MELSKNFEPAGIDQKDEGQADDHRADEARPDIHDEEAEELDEEPEKKRSKK